MKPMTIWALLLLVAGAFANQILGWTDAENRIYSRISNLRQMPDTERGAETAKLALEIRSLPFDKVKLTLAFALANLSTEGDFGRSTLQAVTTTLDEAAREPKADKSQISMAYDELAQLAYFEGMKVGPENPDYRKSMDELQKVEEVRRGVDFELKDLTGKTWKRSELKGKVVLVNFWATWCPPCRKEMPDMETLYNRFEAKGLIVLAISDEKEAKVKDYIDQHHYTFPVLLDPGDQTNKAYAIAGIPKSFIYDKSGKLVAESIDMRTKGQFLRLLSKAGLH
jgi:peroxiredoxin